MPTAGDHSQEKTREWLLVFGDMLGCPSSFLFLPTMSAVKRSTDDEAQRAKIRKLIDSWEEVSEAKTSETKQTTATEKKLEAKDTKETGSKRLSVAELLSREDLEETELSVLKGVIAAVQRPLQKGVTRSNARYRFAIGIQYLKTANGSGQVLSSIPIGKASDWPSILTYQAVFTRFRVVSFSLRVTPGSADNSSATTPHTAVVYFDNTANTVTPTTLTGLWAVPNSVLLQPTAGFGNGQAVVKVSYKSKVEAEQDWFSLLSPDQQRGCLAIAADGMTATTGTLSLWLRVVVEFSGHLL